MYNKGLESAVQRKNLKGRLKGKSTVSVTESQGSPIPLDRPSKSVISFPLPLYPISHVPLALIFPDPAVNHTESHHHLSTILMLLSDWWVGMRERGQ